jgi:hypothetical protein
MSVATSSRPWRLSGSARKWTMLTHLVAGLGWLGADIAFLILSITGLTSDDPALVAACYRAIHQFAVGLLFACGLGSLLSGLLLGLGSKYGLFRYWWVFIKLLLNLILVTLVLVLLRPVADKAAARSEHIDGSLPDRLGMLPTNLMFPPIVSITALLLASYLGLFKPWGCIRRR